MTCEEFQGRLSDAVRDHTEHPLLAAHRESCPQCSAAWDAEWRLQSALEGAAETLAAASVRTAPESLYSELDRAAGARRIRRLAWPLAAAAALALAVLWPRADAPLPPPEPEVVEFLPLAPGGFPRSGGRIIRVYLPGDAPSYWGLPSGAPNMRIPADVLVGDDGIAHGVRFVSAEDSEFGAVSID